MNTIWKYPLRITSEQTIKVPKGASFLNAQMQGEQLCLWVIAKSHEELIEKTILVIGTGHQFDFEESELYYLGTVQQLNGVLIWHVFWII